MLTPDALALHSPWSHLDPRVKLVSFVLLVTTLAFVQAEASACVGVGAALLLLAWSRLPGKHVIGWCLPLVPVWFGIWLASWYSLGWEGGLVQAGRVAATMLLALWLGLTTPLTSLLEGSRRLGLPRVLTLMGLFMARYLHLVHKETETLKHVRRARGVERGESLRDRLALQRLGQLVGEVFVRSHRHGQRAAVALRARTSRAGLVWAPRPRWRFSDTAFALASVMIAAALWILEWRALA